MSVSEVPCVLLCGGASSRMGVDKCFLKFGTQTLVKWQFERLSRIFKKVYISCKNDKFGGEFKDFIFDKSVEISALQSKSVKNLHTLNLVSNSSENLSKNSALNLSDLKNSAAANLKAEFSENLGVGASLKQNENLNFKANFSVNLKRKKSENFSPMIALYSILRHFERGFVFIIAVDSPFVSEKSIERLYFERGESLIIVPSAKNKAHFLCGFYESAILPHCENLLRQNIHKIRTLSEIVPSKFVEFSDEKEFFNINTPKNYEDIKCDKSPF